MSTYIGLNFYLSLAIYLVMAFVIVKKGNSILGWFKRQTMSTKVSVIILLLAALYTVGCLPHSEDAQDYGPWFAIPVAATVVTTMMVVKALLDRSRYRLERNKPLPDSYRRQRNILLLAKVMAWIWSVGWAIYFVAIGLDGKLHVGSELLLRSAVASLDLFWMDIDSNILDNISNNDVLKGMISCTSFTAVICLATLIMSLVMSRMMAWLHIRHLHLDNQRNHLYLFFGLNEASTLLADSVCKEDRQAVVVFVENSLSGEEEQDEDKTDGWKNIVSLLTHRRKTFKDAKENHQRALAIANCDVCDVESKAMEDGLDKEEELDVIGNMGLETVKRLLCELAVTQDGELHVFFLSEDRDLNIHRTIIMAKDRMMGKKQYKTTIYCHASRNGINRIVEDMDLNPEKQIDVRILDSSQLAVDYLKNHAESQPVCFVDIDPINGNNPGTVTSPFVSMVLGFNETGQKALSFLYEYGAFVNNEACPDDSYASPFACYVVDRNMKQLEGQFVSAVPGIKIACGNVKGMPRLQFCEADYCSSEFYEQVLQPIATTLNYVVVAIGDDKTNMAAAVDILRYVRRYRDTLDHFHIFVRAYEKESFVLMDEIVKHYNLRLAKGDGEADAPITNGIITLFGQKKDIFTYEMVIRDEFERKGHTYYEAYRKLQIDPANDEGPWEQRHRDSLSPDKKTKWERLSKIRRKESQDRSNALHSLTKIAILERAVGKEHAADFAQRALAARKGLQNDIHYSRLSEKENRLMLNLAMCEHLRWNAAHVMMGYVDNADGHACDELRKKHNCLKPWQALDKESDAVDYIACYKLFDFGVVETSFTLNYIKQENDEQEEIHSAAD